MKRFITLLMLASFMVPTVFCITANAMQDQATKEHLLTFQRRIYNFDSPQEALKVGMKALQLNGFYIEQIYPLETSVFAIHPALNEQSAYVLPGCGLRVTPVQDSPGRVEIWLSITGNGDTGSNPKVYRYYFNTFEKVMKDRRNGK